MSTDTELAAKACEGPLIWFDVAMQPYHPDLPAAVLECARCDFMIATGNFLDDAHAQTDVLRSPQ